MSEIPFIDAVFLSGLLLWLTSFFDVFFKDHTYCCHYFIDHGASQAACDLQRATLWRRLKKIESIPKRDQKALLHYLDALVQKNVAAG